MGNEIPPVIVCNYEYSRRLLDCFLRIYCLFNMVNTSITDLDNTYNKQENLGCFQLNNKVE